MVLSAARRACLTQKPRHFSDRGFRIETCMGECMREKVRPCQIRSLGFPSVSRSAAPLAYWPENFEGNAQIMRCTIPTI